MTRTLLIAGGGIAGMASAIAAGRTGWRCTVYEQAGSFDELGAGIQLGPNATRVLASWGLGDALARIADEPSALVIRDARSGQQLARMALAGTFRTRYGAPYFTLHRAGLHALLRTAALEGGAVLRPDSSIVAVEDAGDRVWLQMADGTQANGDALIGADGLWSVVRAAVAGSAAPRPSGHLAYRTLVEGEGLAETAEITVWLAPGLHVVAYPVRRSAALNLVVIVEGSAPGDAKDWSRPGTAAQVDAAMASACPPLRSLIAQGRGWRRWSLHDRAPLTDAGEMARGRIALAGDAAHPMLPYLAQGAAMAIEDAQVLGLQLARAGTDAQAPAQALRSYAAERWQRNAKLQRRAARNGRIFHASGALRLARDCALRLGGESLLDQTWLYR